MMTDFLILRAKQEFAVAIGKISLRDSQMSTKAEQLVPLSFLPLVSADVSTQAPLASREIFAKHSSRLNKSLIEEAKSLLFELLQRKRNFQQFEREQNSSLMP